MTKTWWARSVESNGGYGRWIPTGQTDFDDAVFYMNTVYKEVLVKEWMQL